MEKPSRRDILRGLGKAALAAGTLVASAEGVQALRKLDTRDLAPDTREFVEKEAEQLERLRSEIERAEKENGAGSADQLRKLMSDRVRRLQRVLERQREALP